MTQQNELAAIVSGHNDEEINKAIEEQGVDSVLTQVFDGMKNAFLPEERPGKLA